jgi:hypothetical protein
MPDELPQMTQDWIELFQIFEQRDELRPHHNVTVEELLSQPDMQRNGEQIYYYNGIGSFWLTYDEESYNNGELASGTFDAVDGLVRLPRNSDRNPGFMLSQEDHYLERKRGRIESTLSSEITIPVDYEPQTVNNTIGIAETYLDWATEVLQTTDVDTEVLIESIRKA